MDVQVEVQFTIQHTLDELKEEFVRRGHFPDWRGQESHEPIYLETRVVSVNLSSPEDRAAWFVFSVEATGELRKRIVVPHPMPSSTRFDDLDLEDFLAFCRERLVRDSA
ncbi:MAG: hypothetical protein LWX11_10580 [Firmicutes bacterium]|nr:hypothetical protein [Bacillota bacterium]